MQGRVLITGSSGLVGSALQAVLVAQGFHVVGLDLLGSGSDAGDVRDAACVKKAVQDCVGIVHLAAVSRVIWGERDPEGCWATNVGGLKNVLEAAHQSSRQPWFIFASSREVYGQPETLPTTEDAPLKPVNVYGRSKVEGERLVQEKRGQGLRSCIIRLSNVYGSTTDHIDRVVPAFACAAASGKSLRVDGANHTFDFTHLSDTVDGITKLIQYLQSRELTPDPIHFLTGKPTTLGQLANLAVEIAGTQSPIVDGPPRNFDVSHFYGDPSRARKLLQWHPEIDIRAGLTSLIRAFQAQQAKALPIRRDV